MAVRLFLPKGSARLPRPVANALYQIVAMVAQQFEGYIFTVNVDEVWVACTNPLCCKGLWSKLSLDLKLARQPPCTLDMS